MTRVFSQYVSIKSLLLMFVEGLLIVFCVIAGARIRFWNDAAEFESYVQLPDFAFQAGLIVLVFQLCFYYSDLYNLKLIRPQYETLASLGQAAGMATLFLGLLYYIIPQLLVGRGVYFIALGMALTSFLISRVTLEEVWRVAAPQEKTLIVGAHDLAATVAREVCCRNDLTIQLVGFVSDASDAGKMLCGKSYLGEPAELEAIVERHKIRRIIVALQDQRGSLPVRELVRVRVQGVRVEDAHSIISALTGRVWVDTVKPSWFVFSEGFHRSRLDLLYKRLFDLVNGTLGLLISLPLMIVVAVLIKLESKGPVIYRQKRVGLRGKTFDLLKFRSMRTDAEAHGAQWAQKDDPRITRVGKYIRKFRIDELPQFINVIRGDMSFVGPRPERPVFVEQLRNVIVYYDERHSVRPGITGWAQVRYPYGSSVEDAIRKLEYDLFYLKNMSVTFDFAIILQTLRTVLTGEGSR